jgi:hypothetical protein
VISLLEQRLRLFAVVGIDGQADARAYLERLAFKMERPVTPIRGDTVGALKVLSGFACGIISIALRIRCVQVSMCSLRATAQAKIMEQTKDSKPEAAFPTYWMGWG